MSAVRLEEISSYSVSETCPKVWAPASNASTGLPSNVVLPVSGQALTGQLGILLRLVGDGYLPELCLGASGGAIVLAQGIANGWDKDTWMNQLLAICNVDLLRKYPLGYIQAVMEPSIFMRGDGMLNLINNITSQNLNYFRKYELVVNAYNTSVGRTELFTTSAKANSVLNGKTGPMTLLGVACQIHFLGDLPDAQYSSALKQMLLATSSVPIVFDPICIAGSRYVDGGVSFSSPLTAVSCLNPFNDVLYINPNNIDQLVPAGYGVVFDNAISYTSQITRSNALQDRYTYLSSLCCGQFSQLLVIDGKYTEATKADFYHHLAQTKAKPRMVELYPLNSNNATMIETQTRDEYLAQIQDTMTSFGYRIFYVSSN